MSVRKPKTSKKNSPANELKKAGIVPVEMDLVERADIYWRSAHRWIPKVSLWIKLCCVVCFLCAFACVLIVFMRPRPTLLVSFPDGTTLCAPSPLDVKNRRPLPRASEEARLCKMLANRANRPEIENVERADRKEQDDALGHQKAAGAVGLTPPSNVSDGSAPSTNPISQPEASVESPAHQPPSPPTEQGQ